MVAPVAVVLRPSVADVVGLKTVIKSIITVFKNALYGTAPTLIEQTAAAAGMGHEL
jgi:hypothetical protein